MYLDRRVGYFRVRYCRACAAMLAVDATRMVLSLMDARVNLIQMDINSGKIGKIEF